MSDIAYKTRDLSLAAALCTIGYEVSQLSEDENRDTRSDIKVYVFTTNASFLEGKHHERDYYANKMSVPPKYFMEQVRILRKRVEEARRA